MIKDIIESENKILRHFLLYLFNVETKNNYLIKENVSSKAEK